MVIADKTFAKAFSPDGVVGGVVDEAIGPAAGEIWYVDFAYFEVTAGSADADFASANDYQVDFGFANPTATTANVTSPGVGLHGFGGNLGLQINTPNEGDVLSVPDGDSVRGGITPIGGYITDKHNLYTKEGADAGAKGTEFTLTIVMRQVV